MQKSETWGNYFFAEVVVIKEQYAIRLIKFAIGKHVCYVEIN